jgi:hypothetical protein
LRPQPCSWQQSQKKQHAFWILFLGLHVRFLKIKNSIYFLTCYVV